MNSCPLAVLLEKARALGLMQTKRYNGPEKREKQYMYIEEGLLYNGDPDDRDQHHYKHKQATHDQ